MNHQLTPEYILIQTLLASVATLALTAGIYLLLRRNNAFKDTNPPLRLRRWAATFFFCVFLGHLWWLFIYYLPHDGNSFNRILICTSLDTITALPSFLCTMLAMLQDRRRSLWPVAIIVALGLTDLLLVYLVGDRMAIVIFLLFVIILICITITIVYAVRQYGRWLHDNYADLEDKELWQSFVVLLVFMFVSITYSLANDYFIFEILIELADYLLIVFLLWRVETLRTFEEPVTEAVEDMQAPAGPVFSKIKLLLQELFIDTQYYLHHDISLSQLAKLIGTNTTYLSQYFSQQGISYNAYINGLRIEHFIRLYRESANRRNVTASELASESGFHSYSTFSAAFKQFKGQTAREWMRENT